MKKLQLDSLSVDSFATTADAATVAKLRGTVAGHATGQCSAVYGCVESVGGTCWVTCFDSCSCETADCP
jgi:hypothetical protein